MKKRYLIAIAVFSILSIAVVPAEEPDRRKGKGKGEEPGRPPGGGRGDMMKHMPVLVALDADKDGKISSEEIANASAALKTLDKNDDGALTLEELRPPRPPRGEEPRGKRPPRPDDKEKDGDDDSERKKRGKGGKKGQEPTGGGGVAPKRPPIEE